MWSPDGQWLAWSRGYGDAWTGDLARSDGSDLRRDSIGAGPAEWLPDSRGLLVQVHIEAGAFSLGLYSLKMDKVIPLPTGPIRGHALTPDGEAVLAFPGGQDAVPDMVQLASGAASGWSTCAGAEGGAWLREPPVLSVGRPFPWQVALAVRNPETMALRLWLADQSGSRLRETDIAVDLVYGAASLAWVNVGPKP
jgi:hypothetical protein